MTEKSNRNHRIQQLFETFRTDIFVIPLLFLFAIIINRGIEIKGLYMDDLYLWSCYGEQSFLQYCFPIGSTRFRFLYYLAAWAELALIGHHINLIVPINILLNTAVAATVYRMGRKFSGLSYVGAVCGIAYLASRMAYYQISQAYGLMETMALWLAIGILDRLCTYLNEPERNGGSSFFVACGFYFAVCFVHERYMVLLPLFFLVLLMKKSRNWMLYLTAAVNFGVVQLIRVLTIGKLMPAGTGRTQVAETFQVTEAMKYAFSQIAYIFGINAGPMYLNGQNWREASIWVWLFIALADLAILAVSAAFVIKMIRDWKKCGRHLPTCILFLGFIAGCIACSSVTIRLEMRWIYVSYTAALLFLSWMCGVLTEERDIKKNGLVLTAPFAVLITVYVVLMLPVEIYYRNLYPNLYYWSAQKQYNSLADETYGTYGDDIFGKKIYIVGDTYQMSDFTAETFFKVFDKDRKAEGTEVFHIRDIRDIGLVNDDMLVLQEDPERDKYQDITRVARQLKCRGLYGYYSDGWIDEKAELRIMSGSTGKIDFSFYYPGEITGDEWIIISVDGEPELYLQLDDQSTSAVITTQPYRMITLSFETNFYVHDAQEKRGERRLAAIMKMTAD